MTAKEAAYFEDFGVEPQPMAPFEPQLMVIWREHVPVVELFGYAVFKYSDYSGQIVDVDWCAVDVLLNREQVDVPPQTFADWRIALVGYIEAINAAPQPD